MTEKRINGLIANCAQSFLHQPAFSSNNGAKNSQFVNFQNYITRKLRCTMDQHGQVFAILHDAKNRYAEQITSRKITNLIRNAALKQGLSLRRTEINEILENLQGNTERLEERHQIYYRVAPINGGIVIDLGDDQHTHLQISPGKVEIIEQNSEILFYRSSVSQPMAMPADRGNLKLLEKYLNLDAPSIVLMIAWLSYTIAHAKIPTTNYVILILQGNQGTGKTFLSKIIRQLIDPSRIGVQVMPRTGKDLAIAAQNSHCLFFDNVREITQSMSDNLCIAATGGTLTQRQLYSDAGLKVLNQHVALVLNGIYDFVSQPDLAERCLPLQMKPLSEINRKSEAQVFQDFIEELPVILRGLFDLIAEIFRYMPEVTAENPERMIDFVNWLAAMEKVHGIKAGIYQIQYSSTLQQGQLDSLLENTLAASILQFVNSLHEGNWSGTPQNLLETLNSQVSLGMQRSKEWPQNAIALSKRLVPLQRALLNQGINVQFSRGKYRNIVISKTTAYN